MYQILHHENTWYTTLDIPDYRHIDVRSPLIQFVGADRVHRQTCVVVRIADLRKDGKHLTDDHQLDVKYVVGAHDVAHTAAAMLKIVFPLFAG